MYLVPINYLHKKEKMGDTHEELVSEPINEIAMLVIRFKQTGIVKFRLVKAAE